MAVEDAAVLGDLFSRVSSVKQVPALLRAYEDLRYVSHHPSCFRHNLIVATNQAVARDGDTAVVPPEPEDLPPPRRA
jgi:2-polyprenyl-6-methoxyphenol hydroxylase-like FAD-dependent oxidoreductase